MNETQSATGRNRRIVIMDRDSHIDTAHASDTVRRKRVAAWWFWIMQRVWYQWHRAGPLTGLRHAMEHETSLIERSKHSAFVGHDHMKTDPSG